MAFIFGLFLAFKRIYRTKLPKSLFLVAVYRMVTFYKYLKFFFSSSQNHSFTPLQSSAVKSSLPVLMARWLSACDTRKMLVFERIKRTGSPQTKFNSAAVIAPEVASSLVVGGGLAEQWRFTSEILVSFSKRSNLPFVKREETIESSTAK
jgi:hypothetical protein